MKAAVVYEYGGPEVLKYADYPDPAAGQGEVLVRVAAAGINPIDTMERAGLTKDWRPLQFPAVLGWDVAGSVLGLGPGVTGFAVGDRVLAWAYHTYAELCVVKAELLAKVPAGLELAAAAALPLATVTGNQLISVAAAQSGQSVLVSGALGAVGRAALFTARERGARVIAGVRKWQLEAARSLGADEVVALDDETAVTRLAPVDVLANAVRGKTAELLLGKVKAGGVYVSATGLPPTATKFPSIRTVALVAKQDANTLLYMANAVGAGKLAIPIDRRLPLRDAAAAHAAVEKGGIGKVLLLP
ncbi:MAG: NADP-dependent oxidoreductase [Alphaproteobacteria bacterium]|nr:NADP-dependent oxidoreductase [Alphaproteobacteria bacterium]